MYFRMYDCGYTDNVLCALCICRGLENSTIRCKIVSHTHTHTWKWDDTQKATKHLVKPKFIIHIPVTFVVISIWLFFFLLCSILLIASLALRCMNCCVSAYKLSFFLFGVYISIVFTQQQPTNPMLV